MESDRSHARTAGVAKPGEPTHRPAYEREVAVTAGDDPVWREEVLDRLSSLRTAVALLGIVAVAALGVALDVEQASPRDAVSQLSENVESLDERIGAVEDRVESRGGGASEQAVEDLQGDVQQLGDAVEQQQGASP